MCINFSNEVVSSNDDKCADIIRLEGSSLNWVISQSDKRIMMDMYIGWKMAEMIVQICDPSKDARIKYWIYPKKSRWR